MDEAKIAAAYRQRIGPKAAELEALRGRLRQRVRLISAGVAVATAAIAVVLIAYGANLYSVGISAPVFGFVAYCVVYQLIASRFAEQAKVVVLPAIAEVLGDIGPLSVKNGRTWMARARRSGCLPRGAVAVFDAFVGRHRGTDFVMVETRLTVGAERKTRTVFRGPVFAISVPVPVSGRTVVSARFGGVGNSLTKYDIDPEDIHAVPFPDTPAFAELFEVNAESEAEARGLLSPDLRATLTGFMDQFGKGKVRAAFHDDAFFLAIDDRVERFEPVKFSKPVGDLQASTQRLATEMGLAFRIIDDLHDGPSAAR